MSPELALNIVALHDEYEAKGDSRRAEQELDGLVIETMNGLIETAQIPSDDLRRCHAGEGRAQVHLQYLPDADER